jgi:YHS domain-containing protein
MPRDYGIIVLTERGFIMKKIPSFLAAIFLITAFSGAAGLCGDYEAKIVEKGGETTARMLNNYECPVSEDEIIPAEAVMVEYNGNIYKLCCPACAKHFQKFPEKFSQKALKNDQKGPA